MSRGLTFVEIDATKRGRSALERFYRGLYVAEFPDPDERESLANMMRYLALKASGWYGRNNYHVIVMERDGRAIGGSVSDYLAAPNAGVIEFLFTRATERGHGYGSMLLAATVDALARDARGVAGQALAAVVAEMNDPFRRPATPDNMDPFERAGVWGRWGFSLLDFPYVQPALSPRQRAVSGLALVVKPLREPGGAALDAAWVSSVVREYMRWAMRIGQPSRNREYRAMSRYLAARTKVATISLLEYVGRAAAQRMEIKEIGARQRAFRPMMALLEKAIPFAGRTASAAEFERALARRAGRAYRYHLWRLAPPGSPAVHGLASFFTLARCGFGGYVAFDRRLRGKSLLRPLLARIEERMIMDATGARGWLIECDDGAARVFTAAGFRKLPVDYRPPRVGAGAAAGPAERLNLLHKTFGRASTASPPRRQWLLDCVADILRHVYAVRSPRTHECYRRVLRSARRPGRKAS